MGNGLGSGILEVAMALLGIALVALLINKSQNTSQIIQSASSGFNTLLQTVTLQNSSFSGGVSFNQ